MNNGQHHAHCGRTRPSVDAGTTVTGPFGLLSISPMPTTSHQCSTPVPHAVRPMTNMSTVSTNDSRLTTFLRFPPEIRIRIYRLLLKYDGIIRYGICPANLHLAWQRSGFGRKCPRIRHGLFPSILQCCRLLNREGSAVLYGENWFRLGTSSDTILTTWNPGRHSLDSITMLSLGYNWRDSCAQDRRWLDTWELLPSIKEVRIHLYDLSAGEWENFLREASDKLTGVRKAMLTIYVSGRAGTMICENLKLCSQNTIQDMCLQTYHPPFRRQRSIWNNRNVRWEFEECEDEYARSHCILGDLKVFLD